MSKVDTEKREAVALTPMRILRDLGHVVRVKVEPAKGKFNQGLTTVTVRSNPRWGVGGGMDWAGQSQVNVDVVMGTLIAWYNGRDRH